MWQCENCSNIKQAKCKSLRTHSFLASTSSKQKNLNHQFQVDKPSQSWVTDITYMPTNEGWLYLASVMDLPYSCKVPKKVKKTKSKSKINLYCIFWSYLTYMDKGVSVLLALGILVVGGAVDSHHLRSSCTRNLIQRRITWKMNGMNK